MRVASSCAPLLNVRSTRRHGAARGLAFARLHLAVPDFVVLLRPRLVGPAVAHVAVGVLEDRKSTRLNSSHLVISYAVFCLKKKKKKYSTRAWHTSIELLD